MHHFCASAQTLPCLVNHAYGEIGAHFGPRPHPLLTGVLLRMRPIWLQGGSMTRKTSPSKTPSAIRIRCRTVVTASSSSHRHARFPVPKHMAAQFIGRAVHTGRQFLDSLAMTGSVSVLMSILVCRGTECHIRIWHCCTLA